MTSGSPKRTSAPEGTGTTRRRVDVTDGMRQTAFTVATMSGALLLGVLTLGFSPLSNLVGTQSIIGWGACALMSLSFLASIVCGLSVAAGRQVGVGRGNGFDWQALLAILGLVATFVVVGFAVVGTRQAAAQQKSEITRLETELALVSGRLSDAEGRIVAAELELSTVKSDLLRAENELGQLQRGIDQLRQQLDAQ